MMFVAGRSAVLRCCGRSAVAELLTCRGASADWQGRSGEPSGRRCWQGNTAASRPGEDSRDVASKQPAVRLNSLLEVVSLKKIHQHIVLIALADLCGEEVRSGDYLVPLLLPEGEGSRGGTRGMGGSGIRGGTRGVGGSG